MTMIMTKEKKPSSSSAFLSLLILPMEQIYRGPLHIACTGLCRIPRNPLLLPCQLLNCVLPLFLTISPSSSSYISNNYGVSTDLHPHPTDCNCTECWMLSPCRALSNVSTNLYQSDHFWQRHGSCIYLMLIRSGPLGLEQLPYNPLDDLSYSSQKGRGSSGAPTIPSATSRPVWNFGSP